MGSGYDLTLSPDSRFLKFRQNYSSKEHLLSIYERIGAHEQAIEDASADVAREISDLRGAVDAGFDALCDNVSGLREDVRDGFAGMAQLFTWGLESICWQQEQTRVELLDALSHPHRTHADEHWERAQADIRNGRWTYAAEELQDCVGENPRHYLAQYQLGHILFFRLGQSELALKHFKLAALFSDEVGATGEQTYYAAISYAHMSLLHRLFAETADAQTDGCLADALQAAKRAWELAPTLPPAVLELVLGYLLCGDDVEAVKVMASAVGSNEELLLGLERNTDLGFRPEVAAFVRDWRERHGAAFPQVAAVARRARDLLNEYRPQGPALPAAIDDPSLAQPELIASPRTFVATAASAVQDALRTALDDLESRAKRAADEAERLARVANEYRVKRWHCQQALELAQGAAPPDEIAKRVNAWFPCYIGIGLGVGVFAWGAASVCFGAVLAGIGIEPTGLVESVYWVMSLSTATAVAAGGAWIAYKQRTGVETQRAANALALARDADLRSRSELEASNRALVQAETARDEAAVRARDFRTRSETILQDLPSEVVIPQ